jgi:N-acetyl-1-D-myo-inositol-2-amino-2-deoxy-alpha-D-glucopyranoside deacetylase
VSGLLVVTAHPDDEVLIAGGTLAACAEAGVFTAVVCLTRGEQGPIADPVLATRETLGEVRERELRSACAELSVGWVKCYRRPDGELRWSNLSAIARQLAAVFDTRRPDAVVTFGEDGLYYHPDHIAAGDLVCRAAARLTHPPALYRAVWPKPLMRELGAELRARGLSDDLWDLEPEDFGTDDLDGSFAVDVRRFAGQKLRALRAHRTQVSDGNALMALDAELAERFLGTEWFAPILGSTGERFLEGFARG